MKSETIGILSVAGAASLRGLQDILIKFIFLKLITVDIDIEAKKPAYAGRLF